MRDSISQNMDASLSFAERLVEVAARRAELDPDLVSNVLREIDVDVYLLGLVRRFKNLKHILSYTDGQQRILDQQPHLGQWTPLLEWVLKYPSELAQELSMPSIVEQAFLLDQGKDPLMQRGTKRHALQSLLWLPEPNASDAGRTTKFVSLQAQMLLAQVSILRFEYGWARSKARSKPLEDVFDSLYNPLKFARFFYRDRWSVVLSNFPECVDRAAYLKAINKLREGMAHVNEASSPGRRHDSRVIDALTSIAGFLRRGLDPAGYAKRKYNRQRQDTASEDNFDILNVEIGDPDDATFPQVELAVVRRWNPDPDLQKERIEAGEDPADSLLRRNLILVAPNGGGARFVSDALERANQLLSWSYDEQHPIEYLHLVQSMRAKPESIGGELDALELIAWTDTLFWTACSPHQATELRVGLTSATFPACDLSLSVGDLDNLGSRKGGWIRIRALEPEYRTEERVVPGQERHREEYFELPDLGGLCSSVGAVLQCRRMHLPQSNNTADRLGATYTRVFSRETAWYQNALKAFIDDLGESDRITVSRLRATLFQSILESPKGDVVSATLITANTHRLASVRISYSTFSVRHLRELHNAGTERILRTLESTGWMRPTAIRLPEDQNSVGSRSCVLLSTMQEKVRFLQQMVAQDCARKGADEKRKEFQIRHNAFTLLAVWMVDISVGMRAIISPYFHATQYDATTRMGAFTDKDPGGGRKSRLFRLPERTVDFIKNHDAYLARLADQPNLGLPASTRKLPCYFLRMGGTRLVPTEVSPASLREIFGTFFPFAANFARRLVRTEAIERGVPSAYLDAYCGHAYRGEECTNPCSSLDPVHYLDSMEAAINSVLDQLGFTPVSVGSLD